jgi:hypothetical protein
MSPKTDKKAAKKSDKSEKKADKKTLAAQAKAEKKGEVKGSKIQAAAVAAPVEGEEVDTDDFAEEAAASLSAGKAGAAEAITTAVTEGTGTGSLKNFRHHPDIENFYRFIYENDLRFEALQIIDEINVERQARKKLKAEKSKTH